MTLGDRVAVMKKGLLQQVAPPQELYDHPVNLFVAGFIGSPAMNMLGGRLERVGDALRVKLGDQTLDLPASVLATRPALAGYVDRDVIVGIRPEDMEDADLGQPGQGGVLRSRAELVEAMGSDVLVHFGMDTSVIVTEDMRELARDAGSAELGAIDVGRAGDVGQAGEEGGARERQRTVVVARFSPQTRVREGDQVAVDVATERLHFFDPEDGLSLWGAEEMQAERGR